MWKSPPMNQYSELIANEVAQKQQTWFEHRVYLINDCSTHLEPGIYKNIESTCNCLCQQFKGFCFIKNIAAIYNSTISPCVLCSRTALMENVSHPLPAKLTTNTSMLWEFSCQLTPLAKYGCSGFISQNLCHFLGYLANEDLHVSFFWCLHYQCVLHYHQVPILWNSKHHWSMPQANGHEYTGRDTQCKYISSLNPSGHQILKHWTKMLTCQSLE